MIKSIWNDETALTFWVGVAMMLVIATVLAFEHIGGYIPCALCLKQREPYYAAIPLALIALIVRRSGLPECVSRGLMGVVGLLVLYSLVLAAYHSGVEWMWWEGPSECAAPAGNNSSGIDAGSLLDSLAGSKPPACDEAAGRFLGLSFAGWNVVVSAIIAVMAFRAAILKRS